ncbi:collagen alpha-1(I) chain-like [Microtus oregoni]|uniref:collagen alpha-1(I) chain-like n=1 Tax=Microtus oregoni TaxID=111838 RepID=UPI001BB2C07E|nr:collagen alpha-1(I) chain-like [Microtus oregoni]
MPSEVQPGSGARPGEAGFSIWTAARGRSAAQRVCRCKPTGSANPSWVPSIITCVCEKIKRPLFAQGASSPQLSFLRRASWILDPGAASEISSPGLVTTSQVSREKQRAARSPRATAAAPASSSSRPRDRASSGSWRATGAGPEPGDSPDPGRPNHRHHNRPTPAVASWGPGPLPGPGSPAGAPASRPSYLSSAAPALAPIASPREGGHATATGEFGPAGSWRVTSQRPHFLETVMLEADSSRVRRREKKKDSLVTTKEVSPFQHTPRGLCTSTALTSSCPLSGRWCRRMVQMKGGENEMLPEDNGRDSPSHPAQPPAPPSPALTPLSRVCTLPC